MPPIVAITEEAAETCPQPDLAESTSAVGRLAENLHRLKRSLSRLLSPADGIARLRPRLKSLLLSCLMVFLISAGVRLLYLQESYSQLGKQGPQEPCMSDIARHYEIEARRFMQEGRILYPRDPVDAGDARPILHPPGYSAMIAAIFAVFGDSETNIRFVQIFLDALSAVLVLLIAAELLPFSVSVISGLLVALSPHLAYHSLWISPDTVCVLPILAAVWLIIKAKQRPRLAMLVAAGAMIGISCWFRANALLLAPFLSLAVVVVFDKRKRFGYAAALVIATMVVVSPITIRNWILYHHFVPISIAGGENFVVGIADFDKEGRFGMPASDGDVGIKEAEWYGRPEYHDSAWLPDGVERDQARYKRGLAVVRSNPRWFVGVIARRALFMLRYNDSSTAGWPFNTSTVPIVSGEPPVMHRPDIAGDDSPIWSASAASWLGKGSAISTQAGLSLEGESLRLCSDASGFGDQIASPPMMLNPGRDYLLTGAISADPGQIVVKITTVDRRIALASEGIDGQSTIHGPKKEKHRNGILEYGGPESPERPLRLTFPSGQHTEAQVTIANNGVASATGVTHIGAVQLYDLGPTPHLWTRYPRMLVRGLQRNLYRTNSMLPLVIAGIILLAIAMRGSTLIVLLIVPIYYISAQSALSTEYRYILGIHYFLFTAAAITIYCVVSAANSIRVKRPIRSFSFHSPISKQPVHRR